VPLPLCDVACDAENAGHLSARIRQVQWPRPRSARCRVPGRLIDLPPWWSQPTGPRRRNAQRCGRGARERDAPNPASCWPRKRLAASNLFGAVARAASRWKAVRTRNGGVRRCSSVHDDSPCSPRSGDSAPHSRATLPWPLFLSEMSSTSDHKVHRAMGLSEGACGSPMRGRWSGPCRPRRGHLRQESGQGSVARE